MNNSTVISPIKIITFRDLIISSRRALIINFILASVVAVVVSLLLPNWYKSSATVISSSAGGLNPFSGGINIGNPLAAFGLGGVSDEINLYISIIKSRRVRQRLIDQFDLQARYETENNDETLEVLNANIDFFVTEEGALNFGVSDKDQMTAKNMADALLEELGAISTSLGSASGTLNRRFIERRIADIESNLSLTERELRDLAVEHGTYDIATQIPIVVEQLITQEIKLAEAEIQYNVAASRTTANNPELEILRVQKNEIEKKYTEFLEGRTKGNAFPELAAIPNIMLEYAKLKRTVEIQATVLAYLYPQFEQAKLQEAKDKPILQVLDFPSIPIKKDRPYRSLIVISVSMMSILTTLMWKYYLLAAKNAE